MFNKKVIHTYLVAVLLSPLFFLFLELLPVNFTQTEWEDKEKLGASWSSHGVEFLKLYQWQHVGLEVYCDDKDLAKSFAESFAAELARTKLIPKISILSDSNSFEEKERLDALFRLYLKKPQVKNALFSQVGDFECALKVQNLNYIHQAYASTDHYKISAFTGSWQSSAKQFSLFKLKSMDEQGLKHLSRKMAQAYKKNREQLSAGMYPLGEEKQYDTLVQKAKKVQLNTNLKMPESLEFCSATRSYGVLTGAFYEYSYRVRDLTEADLFKLGREIFEMNGFIYRSRGEKAEDSDYHPNTFVEIPLFYNKGMSQQAGLYFTENGKHRHYFKSLDFDTNKRDDYLVRVTVLEDFSIDFSYQKRLRLLREALADGDLERLEFVYCSKVSFSFDDLPKEPMYKLETEAIQSLLNSDPNSPRYQGMAALHYKDQPQKQLEYLRKIHKFCEGKNELYKIRLNIEKKIAEREQAKEEISDV